MDNKPATSRSRNGWKVMAIILTSVVGIAMIIIGSLSLLNILRQGGQAAIDGLNGPEISVSDESIRTKVASDSTLLLDGSFMLFYEKMGYENVRESQPRTRFENVIATLNSAGACVFEVQDISKQQGGFSNGASIEVLGKVACSDQADSHPMTLTYRGYAQSREAANTIDSFALADVEIETKNELVVRLAEDFFVQAFLSQNAEDGEDTRFRYDSFSEYERALSGGEIGRSCTLKEPIKYRIEVSSAVMAGEPEELNVPSRATYVALVCDKVVKKSS